jgi:Raf kinase inhibitor-like YbhB/YbcL family protein
MRLSLLGLLCVLGVLAIGCSRPGVGTVAPAIENQTSAPAQVGVSIMALQITSPAFQNNSSIPAKYTCQGQDISPPLRLAGVPQNAKSLVLLMDDPDAPMGTWDHWILFNIPPETTAIAENSVPAGAVVGRNSWPKNSYGGPCPPSGTHRYFFKLYALDSTLDLTSNVTKRDVERAMDGRVIAQAQLVGTYKKS